MTKPFNPLELVARVKSQLRRYTKLGSTVSAGEQEEVYTVGGLSINDDLKEVTVDGELAKLTPTEYDILLLTCENQESIFYRSVTRTSGMRRYQGGQCTVAVHIRHIREKIEINPKDPRYPKRVWGSRI